MRSVTKMAQVKTQKKKVWATMSIPLEIPTGVSAKYEGGILIVTGPKGEISKKLKYPRVQIKIETDKIIIRTDRLSQVEKRIMFTYNAHVKNLLKGVTEGYTYKLAIVYAKFPLSADFANGKFTVKNLLGERVPRVVKIPSDVKVEVKGKDIIVTGIDKEKTGQVAASLEQLTRITHFDRRVIQDGIYITEKPHRRYI